MTPTTPLVGAIPLAPTVQARISFYLNALHVNDGESTHSFRSGTAILLRLLGASKDDVVRHIGWKSTEMVDLYTQIDKVVGISSPRISAQNPLDLNNELLVEKLGSQFRESNLLIGFKPAFV